MKFLSNIVNSGSTSYPNIGNSTYNEESVLVLNPLTNVAVKERKPFVEGTTEKSIAQTYTKGIGTITVTNGSAVATGSGSNNWTSSDPIRGMSFWLNAIFKDSNNVWYRAANMTVNSATQFTSTAWYSNAMLINGAGTPSSTYSGVTGTYEYYIVRNFADQYSIALGTNSIATNFSLAFGSGTAASGSASFAFGSNNAAKGTNSLSIGQSNFSYTGIAAMALGRRSRAAGNGSFASGHGTIVGGSTADATGAATDKRIYALGQASFNHSENTTAQIGGHGALAQASAILGGQNHNIPSNSNRSVILGGNAIKAFSADTDTVYLPKVRIGQGTGGALTSGSTSVDLLVRNVGGIIQTRTVSSIISGSSVTANNGLTKSGNNIHLGGKLTGNTEIIGSKNFLITMTGATENNEYIFVGLDGTNVGSGFFTSAFNTTLSHQEKATGYSSDFNLTSGATVMQSSHPNFAGITYDADYSANFGPRSIPDVEYVHYWVSANTSGWKQDGTTELTGQVIIDGQGNYLRFEDNYDFEVVNSSGRLRLLGDGGFELVGTSYGIDLWGTSSVSANAGRIRLYQDTARIGSTPEDATGYNDIDYTSLIKFTNTEAKFIDNRLTPVGLEYADDYSANFTDRSLVDKAWVLANAGGSGTTNAGNGLTKIDNTIHWGGEISGYTTIHGSDNAIIDYTLENGGGLSVYVYSGNTSTKYAGFGYGAGDIEHAVGDPTTGWLGKFGVGSDGWATGKNVYLQAYNTGDATTTELKLSWGKFEITSTVDAFSGASYAADYSANFGPRSIPDVAWVTGQTGGGSAINMVSVVSSTTLANTVDIALVSSSGGTVTVTLPSSPNPNKKITIKDRTGHALTNNITINGNGRNIDGSSTALLNTSRAAIELAYSSQFDEYYIVSFVN